MSWNIDEIMDYKAPSFEDNGKVTIGIERFTEMIQRQKDLEKALIRENTDYRNQYEARRNAELDLDKLRDQDEALRESLQNYKDFVAEKELEDDFKLWLAKKSLEEEEGDY